METLGDCGGRRAAGGAARAQVERPVSDILHALDQRIIALSRLSDHNAMAIRQSSPRSPRSQRSNIMFELESNKRLVVMSAQLDRHSGPEAADAHRSLQRLLATYQAHGVIDALIPCAGMYKNTPERSFAVICNIDALRGQGGLIDTARRFGQESVLIARQWGDDITGALVFCDNSGEEDLGKLVQCDPAKTYDAYTRIMGTRFEFTFE